MEIKMTLEEKLVFKPYNFKYDEDDILMLKSVDEIKRINEVLKKENPESDYNRYSWYLNDELIQEIKYERLKIERRISWHVGLPFYKLYKLYRLEGIDGYKLGRADDVLYTIAEFYLQEHGAFKPNSEGLTLDETFKNIPEEESIRIKSRVPVKVGELNAAYEKYETFGSGHESLLFLYDDVKDMKDEEIKDFARIFPRADQCGSLSVSRRKNIGVVYVSFCFHRISRVPGTKSW